MLEHTLSRRTFLAVSGLSTATLLGGCAAYTIPTSRLAPTATPNRSPLLTGPYQVNRVILGEDPGTKGMPQPFAPGGLLPISESGFAALPKSVHAAVYYPHTEQFPTDTPLSISGGPFPVLLYAHAFRGDLFSNVGAAPATRDFTSVEAILQHVASYGCIAVAPDLSWLTDQWTSVTQETFTERGVVLVNYYAYLASLNSTLFANQLDVSRVVLVGHSTGGGGVTYAGRAISGFSHPKSLAYGLIAPELGGNSGPDIGNLLVLGGTLDIDQDAEPGTAYSVGGTPKTLVMIPGANHFGYTDICPSDNSCDSIGLLDENGTISRSAQQQTAAAYLAALVRYYAHGDATFRPYLSGEQMVEGLDTLGVTGLQIQEEGYLTLKQPLPTIVPKKA
jgi:hypothetical protein